MILNFSVQVLQELNAVLLIVSSLKAPLALVLFSWRFGCALSLFFKLGSRLRHKIPLLVVVFEQVDTVNTSIVTLDPLQFLDTYSYEFLKCPLLIHRVIVDIKGLKLLCSELKIN
jgi:hypothetical protein